MEKKHPLKMKNKTPVLIMITCVYGVLNCIASIETIRDHVFPLCSFLLIAATLVCMLGLFKMKAWAVFAYISVFVVHQLILLGVDQFVLSQAMLPTLLISINFKYLKKMS